MIVGGIVNVVMLKKHLGTKRDMKLANPVTGVVKTPLIFSARIHPEATKGCGDNFWVIYPSKNRA